MHEEKQKLLLIVKQAQFGKTELVLTSILSLVLLGWTMFSVIRVNSTSLSELEDLLETSLFGYFQGLSESVQSSLAATNVFTTLVWVVIGFLVYFIIWIVTSLVLDAKNTVSFTKGYIHPPLFDIRKYFLLAAIEKFVFAILSALTVVLGGFFANTIIPGTANFYIKLVQQPSAIAGLKALLGTLSFITFTHIIIVLIRLITNRYQRV